MGCCVWSTACGSAACVNAVCVALRVEGEHGDVGMK